MGINKDLLLCVYFLAVGLYHQGLVQDTGVIRCNSIYDGCLNNQYNRKDGQVVTLKQGNKD